MKKFIRVAAVALAIVAALGLFGCKKSKADYSHAAKYRLNASALRLPKRRTSK